MVVVALIIAEMGDVMVPNGFVPMAIEPLLRCHFLQDSLCRLNGLAHHPDQHVVQPVSSPIKICCAVFVVLTATDTSTELSQSCLEPLGWTKKEAALQTPLHPTEL